MKSTITAAQIIEQHATELDHAPCGYEETIREMLAAEPDTVWRLVDAQTAPNGVACPTYAAASVGQAGPVVLGIYDAAEPFWVTGAEAERLLTELTPAPVAIVYVDGDGPALGIGADESAAWADAEAASITDRDGLHAVQITSESYLRILAGDPDAWEAAA